MPWLTVCVALGLIAGQLPLSRSARLAPGVAFSGRTLMRAGIVLLGMQVSMGQLLGLGWVRIVGVVAVLLLAFGFTYVLARVVGLPGSQPLLMAAGFSICGASAIGAVGDARGASRDEQGVPVALVTLCGTAAIVLLPLARGWVGLQDAAFGQWVGASVHDVGQVVAAASIAGPAALALAVAVKLVRVLCLAPMVAAVTIRHRAAGARVPIVPWFVAGFLVCVAVRTWVPLSAGVLDAVGFVQHLLLGTALVALLSRVRLKALGGQDRRALLVAVASSIFIALAALGVLTLG